VCIKSFKVKAHLNAHKARHTGENVYSCGQCEKCFSSVSGLWMHMNIHRSRYKCTECGKCTGNRRALAVHMRTHTGEKLFECTVCNKRFSEIGNLVLLSTAEFTVERNHTNVTCVTWFLVSLHIWTIT